MDSYQSKYWICDKCLVEITESKIRRYRMGYIRLVSPVIHPWYLNSVPNYLSIILDKKIKDIENIIYFKAYLVLNLKSKNQMKQEKNDWKNYYRWYYSQAFLNKNKKGFLDKKMEKETRLSKMTFDFGTEAIQNLLANLKLKSITKKICQKIKDLNEKNNSSEKKIIIQKKKKQIQRLRLLNYFIQTKSKPEWMIISYLPVLPPELRPIILMEGGVRHGIF